MKITKYEHACLDIKEGGDRLVIDPGVYSASLADFSGITALVITHIHQDHFDIEKVNKIIADNPSVHIFTTQEVAEQIKDGELIVVSNNIEHQVGQFKLEFYGDQHATIDDSYPVCHNTGVLVNEVLYYPGDSLTACPKPYEILAQPTMAPWLKFSEAVPFIEASPASRIFPSHNGFLNSDGQALYDRLFKSVSEQKNKTYQFIAPGESIEV